VTEVTLPDSSTVEYRYAGGFLSEVEYPDGAISAFDYASLAGGLVKMDIEDFGATAGHRRKTVYVSGSAGTVDGTIVPTSVGMARMVVNGSGEVTYANFSSGDPDSYSPGEDWGLSMRGEAAQKPSWTVTGAWWELPM
jgi:hypothetical protein